MPNRILKDSICVSDNLDRLNAFEENFFYRLLVNCDDYGRMDARPAVLKARLYPLRPLELTVMEEALAALEKADLIAVYTARGLRYLQVITWEKHQQVRAKRSRYPGPEEGTLSSGTGDVGAVTAPDSARGQKISSDSACPRNPIRIQNVSVSESGSGSAWRPPTSAEVADYAREQGLEMDAERFVDFYTSKGWRVGGERMVDWQASARLWARRNGHEAPADREKKVSAQRYDQRQYTEKELDAIAEDPILRALEACGAGKDG